MDIENIVVIGASAGGIQAIDRLFATMPDNLPVAFFVVIHMSSRSIPTIITKQLQKKTGYVCEIAADNAPIEQGHVYLAPPNVHMIVKKGVMRLVDGPHENRWRPSIDVLFRSAAAAYGSQSTGIILSGLMDDGTSGMSAIQRCGGLCIVQEPEEAEYMDMPINVISNVNVDYRVPIADMGYIIADMISKPRKARPIPEDVKIEAEITERMVSKIEDLSKIANHSNFTCPDCGGGLWKIKNEKLPRYRCHTGHVYTEKLLLERQSEEMEESLWVCIRMMEERRNLLINMDKNGASEDTIALPYKQKAEELATHIERLKHLLTSFRKDSQINDPYL